MLVQRLTLIIISPIPSSRLSQAQVSAATAAAASARQDGRQQRGREGQKRVREAYEVVGRVGLSAMCDGASECDSISLTRTRLQRALSPTLPQHHHPPPPSTASDGTRRRLQSTTSCAAPGKRYVVRLFIRFLLPPLPSHDTISPYRPPLSSVLAAALLISQLYSALSTFKTSSPPFHYPHHTTDRRTSNALPRLLRASRCRRPQHGHRYC